MRAVILTFVLISSLCHESMAQILRTDGAMINVNSTATVLVPSSVSIQAVGGILNAGTIYLKGDWINNGQGLLGALPGTVDFNGNQTQFIGGNNTTTFAFLRQSNSAGIFLSNNVHVGSTLIFNNGKMVTGPYEVRMINYPANAILGASANQYINGNLRVAFDTANAAQYKYEIGSSVYAPIEISINALTDGGTLLAFTTTGASSLENFPTNGASGLDPFARVDRHWILSQSSMLFQDFEATFDFNQSSYTGSVQDYTIRHNDPLLGWVSESTSNNGSTATGVLSDGLFVIGELANTSLYEPQSDSIWIFPNPTNGNFSVFGHEGKPFSLVVCDITGRPVYKSESDGEVNTSIELASFNPAPGTYILTIQSGKKHHNKRIIIH